MKKLHALVVAGMMAGSHQALALINDSKFNEPGELFISVWDEAGAKSYYKDLGITMTDFMDGKSCIAGDLAQDPIFAAFAGAQGLVYNVAAVNSLLQDQSNITKWGYLATSASDGGIFNANWSAIDGARQKIQSYIGNLNVVAFTNAPGEAAENKSGVFLATDPGYHGSPAWGASMGQSVGGSTEGASGTALDFYFVNNANGTASGKNVVKLGAWKLDGAKLSYSGTGTTAICSGGGGTNYPLTVTLAGTGAGTVTSDPAGINCGTTCSASFPSGSTVKLTAAAGANSSFAGWQGASCSGSTAPTCDVAVSAAANVQATFNSSAPPPGPFIKLSAPTVWVVKQVQTISWTTDGIDPKQKVKLTFSKDGGVKFKNIGSVKVTKAAKNWKPKKSFVTENGVIQACVKPGKKMTPVCNTVQVQVQQ